MQLQELQIPSPQYWQQFEDLCLSIFREVWKDPTAQKNGRVGQPQNGTDIWGRANGQFVGVQCKGKDVGLGATLTEDELRSEVEKAKGFNPPLVTWTLATTAPKDTHIEELARLITVEHQNKGLFEVRVLGWGDLISLMSRSVIERHYPDLVPRLATVPDTADDLRRKIEERELHRISRGLLVAGSPPTLLPLFPGVPEPARKALEQFGRLRRTISEFTPDLQRRQKALQIPELLAADQLHHLILAAPGSGKTYALWHAAEKMLAVGDWIPIFVPLSGLVAWDDVVEAIAEVANGTDVAALLHDARVCVILDGWSEFDSTYGIDERARAMRALSRTRVIASSRYGLTSDAPFRVWTLDPPPTIDVERAIKTAFPASPPAEPALIELLRLPLALSLFILLGGSASTRGELLTRLHNHLSYGFPEGFRDALSGAIASVILLRQGRSYSRLESEIRERAARASVANPAALLRRLGTLEDRAGAVVPVHDLYWSWLGGIGLIAEDLVQFSVSQLATRECYELALESGALPTPSMVSDASRIDVTLSALLSAHLVGKSAADGAFFSRVKTMFEDIRLPVRCRAALAALRSRKPDWMRSALNVLTEIHEAQLYVHAFDAALIPAELFPCRGIIAGWLGENGTDQVIDAIANRGDASWGTWLEQMAKSGKLSVPAAAAAALACEARVPEWTVQHLVTLTKSEPWRLRPIASRGTNIEFARWLGEHYEECIDSLGGGWTNLNRVLVACGDDVTFERLLLRFSSMSNKAQELLGFAIVDRGDPWIARFQKIAFASGFATHHHRLAEPVSPEIDDATARHWVANGPSELGWRVLIVRHGASILPEMIANLPASFSDQHYLPALSAMRFLTDAPHSLIDEILRRMRGQMQPRATEDAINALARVRLTGVPSIVGLILDQPRLLPAYHLARALRLIKEWGKETHLKLKVRSGYGETSFEEWILLTRLPQDKNDAMFRRALSIYSDLAVRIILQYFRDDEKAINEILEQMEPLIGYHQELFDFLIARPKLSFLVLKIFSGSFDTFPEAALCRAVDAPGIEFAAFLRALATSSSPAHVKLHKTLVIKLLALQLDLFSYREMAKILRVHPTAELLELLKDAISEMEANQMWLVRAVEMERGELLVNEMGQWLQ